MADLFAFLAASTLVILIPGPDTLVVLRGVLFHGRRSAALTAAGVLTGLSIWMAAAALGVTALSARAATTATSCCAWSGPGTSC